MLVAYLGSSSRAMQFVKEFLDRRRPCWQLHRKRMEEMTSQQQQQTKQTSGDGHKKTTVDSAGVGASSLTTVASNGVYAHAYNESSDVQSDNPVTISFVFMPSRK